MKNSLKALRERRLQGAPAPAQALSAQEGQRLQLAQHLRKLVDANPKAAREALEMSQEQAPELFLIAQNQPQAQWAESLMSSESMLSLMSRNPNQAKTLLEQPDLRSLLELLP